MVNCPGHGQHGAEQAAGGACVWGSLTASTTGRGRQKRRGFWLNCETCFQTEPLEEVEDSREETHELPSRGTEREEEAPSLPEDAVRTRSGPR